MIPIEIQDKIFLYFDYINLERTRELQSSYVKNMTKYGNFTDFTRYESIYVEADKTDILNNVKWLLNQGFDPSANDNYTIRLASRYGFTDVVKLLLSDSRVDLSTDDNEAIHLASNYGHTEIVKLLMSDPRVDPSDNEAIRLASRNGHIEIVKLLLGDPRVDPSANDNYAIRWASFNDYTEIVKLLMSDTRVGPTFTKMN